MSFFHDLPENKGIENGIKRAKQMTDFRWTPIEPLPALLSFRDMSDERQYTGWRMRPYLPQKGLVYSSIQENQKYIGFNVSFEAFVTALSDPNSVLYRQNVYGHGRRNANTWYGVVCSCFASYVFDMKERCICKQWPDRKDVRCLGKLNPDDIRLLDVVLNPRQHIAVVTDILRDNRGHAAWIEVSEAVMPTCRATYFTPQEFVGYWYGNGFEIYRKSGTESIRYTPSPFVRVEAEPERGIEGDPALPPYRCNADILPNQGNGTNYREDQEIALNLLREGWDGAEITAANGARAFFEANGQRVVIPIDSPFHAPGFYTAKAVRQNGSASSEPVAFCVTGLRLSSTHPAVASPAETITLCSENAVGDRSGSVYIFNASNFGEAGRFEPNPDESHITVTLPSAVGEYFIVQTSENIYGEYSSNRLCFRVEA